MHKIPLTLAALAFATAAHATGPIAVSVKGVDNPSCGDVSAPCRMLEYVTSGLGGGVTINILDSGDYGRLVISTAVSVVYEGGGVALVQPTTANGSAVVINASPLDTVRLKGLTIDGGGTGRHGVVFNGGARLEIENCAIHNFTGQGVFVKAANSSFSIVNSTVGSNGEFGLYAWAPSGAMRGSADRLRLFGNTAGGMIVNAASDATNDVVVTNSVAMGHQSGAGFRATGAGAKLTLTDTTTMDNSIGAQATRGATARLSDSILVGNAAGVAKSGGAIETFGNNIFNNPNDALGALTPVPLH